MIPDTSTSDRLLYSIQSIGQFKDEEIVQFTKKLELKVYKKGDRLLEVGEICDWLWFIEKGSVYQYSNNSNLDQVISGLFTEGHWALDQSSFVGRKPAIQYLEAYQDTTVFGISICSLHELIGKSQVFFQLGKILEIKPVPAFRSDQSPDDRYLHLMEYEPHILKTFPLRYIASFLGITPETLSRVRKRIFDIS